VPFASAFVSDRYTSPSSHTTAAGRAHAPPALVSLDAVEGEGLGGCTGGGAVGSGVAGAGISLPSGPKTMSSEELVVDWAVGVACVGGGAVGDGLKPPVPSGMGSGGRV
jgi:hypothetical protein